MYKKPVCLLFILAVIFALSCSNKEKTVKISFKKVESAKTKTGKDKNTINIAVGSMITPIDGFILYKDLLNYIGEKMGKRVVFVDRESYSEINRLIKTGETDVAFICSGPYVEGRSEFGMELLAAPQVNGVTEYYSYIIVSKDSPINELRGLKGRTFAFVEPLSFTGKLVPMYLLAQMNETPETFFEKYIFSVTHDKAIKAVAQGIVDGAGVNSLIWDYFNATNPEYTSKTRIIYKSVPYGIPPVVVSSQLDSETKQKVREILLNVHNDEKGREILKKMLIDKFVVINDSAYDGIRKIRNELAKYQNRKQKK